MTVISGQSDIQWGAECSVVSPWSPYDKRAAGQYAKYLLCTHVFRGAADLTGVLQVTVETESKACMGVVHTHA